MPVDLPARKRLRVVIADDHPTVLRGVRATLPDATVSIVAEAMDGRAALSACLEHRPDIAVLDMYLPHLNGVQIVQELARELPGVKAIILSMSEDPWLVREALAAGARGYVFKTSTQDQLRHAVARVASGHIYLDRTMAERHGAPGWRLDEPQPAKSLLSKREVEVLRLLARGASGKEVALELDLSPRTLETYRARAMHKLQLRSRIDLMRFAVHSGWLG